MKPICETDIYGTKHYYLNNKPHREDGPAVERANGYKAWYYHGERHRIDGPAIEFTAGTKLWFYHGKRIDCKNNEEFLRMIRLKMFW